MMTDQDSYSGIDSGEALALLTTSDQEIMGLIGRADQVRRAYFGNKIQTCAIINAKSGNCGEDCKFCPQSIHAESEIEEYALLDEERITAAAKEAEANHAHTFGIVTSGRYLEGEPEKAGICKSVKHIAEETAIGPCASLGTVDEAYLRKLKDAGLVSYHHNLEAAESFYPNICTTRSYQDNVATLKAAKRVGLKVCSGCLFGLGESDAQRIELLAALQQLEVDSIPINFLHPRDGTPICRSEPQALTPLTCLKIIAVARLMLPDRTIRICGGREFNLRDMQSWIFAAGANAVMIGSYLTTRGRDIEDDLQMIRDAGMVLA